MWWIVFSAVDFYVGLIALDVLIPSLSPEKVPRATIARKVVLVLLACHIIALAGILIRRWTA